MLRRTARWSPSPQPTMADASASAVIAPPSVTFVIDSVLPASMFRPRLPNARILVVGVRWQQEKEKAEAEIRFGLSDPVEVVAAQNSYFA